PAQPVEVVTALAEPALDRGEFALELVQVGARAAQRLPRVPRVALELLRQVRDDEAATLRDLSRVGRLLAGQDAKQRRLAAAVRADHAQADARLDVEVEPAQDLAGAEALDDAAGGDQGHGSSLRE